MHNFEYKIRGLNGNFSAEQRQDFLMSEIARFFKQGHTVDAVEISSSGALVTCSEVNLAAICDAIKMKMVLTEAFADASVSYNDSFESRCLFDTVAPFIKEIYGYDIKDNRRLENILCNKENDYLELLFHPHKIINLSFSLIEQGIGACDEFKRQRRISSLKYEIGNLEQRIASDNRTVNRLKEELDNLIENETGV